MRSDLHARNGGRSLIEPLESRRMLAAGGVGSDTKVRHDRAVIGEATWDLSSGSLTQHVAISAGAFDYSDLPQVHDSIVIVGVILERIDGSSGFHFSGDAFDASTNVTVNHGAAGTSMHVVADLNDRWAFVRTAGSVTPQLVDIHIDVTITAAGDFTNSVDTSRVGFVNDDFYPYAEGINSHTRSAEAVATGTITVDYLPGVNFAAGPSTSGEITTYATNYREINPPGKQDLLGLVASSLFSETAVLS